MEENGTPNTQEFSGGEKPKKGMPIVISILFILVLLCAGGLGVVNFFPEVIPAKMVYMLAEKQNIMQVQKQIDGYMNDGFVKDALKVYNTPFKNDTTVTFKFKPETLQAPEAAQLKVINDILSSSSLKINESSDYKNEKTKAEYILNVKGINLLNAEMFLDKKKLGFKIPAFYNKYIVVNGDDLAPVYEKFNKPVEMKKLVTNSDILKAIKFDKEEAFRLMNNYGEYLVKQLNDKNFKFTKGVKLKTSEGDINCNQVALTLTMSEMKNISIKMLEKIQNDDKLLNLTAGNVLNVMKLYEDAGYYGTAGLPSEFKDINSIKNKIKQAIDEVKKDTTAESDKSEMVMTLLLDRKFNILERKIEAVSKGADSTVTGTVAFRLAGFSQPKSKGKETIFEVQDTAAKTRFTIDAVEAPKIKGELKTVVNIESGVNYGGTEEKPFTCKIDISDNSEKDKSKKVNAKFESNIATYGTEKTIVSGAVTVDSTRDAAAGTVVSNVSVDTNVKSPTMSQQTGEIGVVLGIGSNMKFGEPVNLPSIDASNSLDINTASKDQIDQAMMEIQTAVQKLYLDSLKLLAPAGA